MRKLAPLLVSSLVCLALGACEDVSLGTDGMGGAGGTAGNSSVVPNGGSGAGGMVGTGGSETGGSSAGTVPVTCGGTSILANTVNDYTFSATLTMAPVMVKPKSDLLIDWSSVTKTSMGVLSIRSRI